MATYVDIIDICIYVYICVYIYGKSILVSPLGGGVQVYLGGWGGYTSILGGVFGLVKGSGIGCAACTGGR